MSGHTPLPPEPLTLALLPLRDVVVFPHMVIPLFVGRPKSIKALEVTLALGADMLVLGRLAPDVDKARTQLMAALEQGQAAERFARMVCALGGPADLLDRPDAHLAAAPVVLPVPAPRSGVVAAHATRDIGVAVIELGGGRRKASDAIDHRVGFSRVAAPGTAVRAGEPLAWVHAADADTAARAVAALQRHLPVGERAEPVAPVLIEHLLAA